MRKCGSRSRRDDGREGHSSAPARRAANSISAATSTSVVPRTHDLHSALEDPLRAPPPRGSVASARPPSSENFSTTVGASFSVIADGRESGHERFFSATLNARPLCRSPIREQFSLRSTSPTAQQRPSGNHDLRAVHLVMRLRIVANVGDEETAGLLHQQNARAAGESAKVSNIWQMADEKSVKAGSRKMLPKLVLTSLKIHCCEFSKKHRTPLYFIATAERLLGLYLTLGAATTTMAARSIGHPEGVQLMRRLQNLLLRSMRAVTGDPRLQQ